MFQDENLLQGGAGSLPAKEFNGYPEREFNGSSKMFEDDTAKPTYKCVSTVTESECNDGKELYVDFVELVNRLQAKRVEKKMPYMKYTDKEANFSPKDVRLMQVAYPLFGLRSMLSDKADAHVVAFSGGGEETTYSYAHSTSSTLVLNFNMNDMDDHSFHQAGHLNPFVVSAEWSHTEASEKHRATENEQEDGIESETAIEFTLADVTTGDYFDVGVYQDRVYGTPVFKTLAGRSKCPHEFMTDARQAFDVQFPKEENQLDLVGDSTSLKARSVSVPKGSSEGTCASFYLNVINESPYEERLELIIDILPPEDVDIFGKFDYQGLILGGAYQNVIGGEYLPMMSYGTRLFRLNICPDDDRGFKAREERMKGKCNDRFEDDKKTRRTIDSCIGNYDHDNNIETEQVPRVWKEGVLDMNGAAMSGYVYCNVPIMVGSKCEDPTVYNSGSADTDIENGHIIEEGMEMEMCSNYDMVNERTFQPRSGCFNKILPEIFDGNSAIGNGLQYVVEQPLMRKVLIPCLNFDPTQDRCKDNPCRGMHGGTP
eukprot:g4751.t1